MSDTVLDRFTIGAGKILPVDHTGPASYTTGGETLGNINNMTGISVVGLGSLDMVLGSGSLSESGNYQVAVQQTGLGSRKTFNLLWYYAAGAGGAGVDYITVTAGGTYTGTTPTVTLTAAPAGGTTSTAVAVLNGAGTAVIGFLVTNPGSGYLVAPTVTVSTGGANGTAVLNPSGATGSQVASATNLSGETVRIGYVGR